MAGLDDKRGLMQIGPNVFQAGVLEGRQAALCSMSEPLKLLDPLLLERFAHVELVTSMDMDVVAAATARFPQGLDVVVGFGGGSSLDLAKYVAWQRQLPGILVPSVLSVDACVTATAAVRDGGRVRYVGHFIPEAILIDHALLRAAPPALNRAGAADILSIHTALHDWQLAATTTGERFDAAIARQAEGLLHDLGDHAEAIRDCSPDGLTFLATAFAVEDAFCTRFGASRPEEGSEHFLAYVLEYQTRRHFIHGELVALGIVVMSALQRNNPNFAMTLLRRLGIPYHLEHLGLTPEHLREAVAALPAYVRAENLPYSVAHTLDDDLDATLELVDEIIATHLEGWSPA